MNYWMYQLNAEKWPRERYLLDLWEGIVWAWDVGQIRAANQILPKPGDVVVFFAAPAGATMPGFLGWAIVTEYYEERKVLYFKPTRPTDQLKLHPWWDGVKPIADDIRGGMTQATMFLMTEKDFVRVSEGVRTWLGS